MNQRLVAVQALRGLGATFVVFAHAQNNYAERVGPLADVLCAFPWGDVGVLIFFCISGFIIYTAGARLPAGWASVRWFGWRRIIRVVPLYWVVTLLYAAKLSLAGAPPTVEALAKSLLFVPYGAGMMRPVLGVGWTLNYEMLFYAVFACAVLLRGPLRLPAVFLVLMSMRVAVIAGWFDPANAGDSRSALDYLSEHYLDYFLLGMLLGYLRSLRTDRNQRAAGLSPSAAAVAASAVALIGSGTIAWLAPPAAIAASATFGVVAATMALCLLEDSTAARPRWAMRVVQGAGDASYSTYLTHGFLIGPAARLLHRSGGLVSSWCFGLGMVVLCTLLGHAIYRLVEQPILDRLGRIRRPAREPQAPATR